MGRFDWQRYAVQTNPRVAKQGESIKIPIPWPKPPERPIPSSELQM
jgi:hypothetical protein